MVKGLRIAIVPFMVSIQDSHFEEPSWAIPME